MLALPFSGFSLPAKSINAVHGKLLCNSNFLQQHWHFLNIHFRWKIAREKQIREKQIAPSVLADATTGFCTKWRLIEKLAQKFHTDDASLLRSRLCLWLAENFLRAIRSTTQIWEVTRQSMEFLCLFLTRHFAGWWRCIMSAVFSDYIIPSIHQTTISAQEIAQLLYNIYVFK